MAKHTPGRGAIRHLSLRMIDGGDPLKPVAPLAAPVAVAPVAPPVAPNAADNAMMAANLRDGVGAYNSTSYGAVKPPAATAVTPAAPGAPAIPGAPAPVVAPVAKPVSDPGFSSGYMAEQAARNARVGQPQPSGSNAARAWGNANVGSSFGAIRSQTPVTPAIAPVTPTIAAPKPELLALQNGGMFDGLKRGLGMGPAETVTEKYARQDAERAAKAKPATEAVKPAVTPASSPGGIPSYVGNPALDARMKAAGLKNGGELQSGKGGHVPGKGHGDKIDAKYEPGEFVVSNDMLDMAPGLREHLHELRTQALAKKGMTPAMADAKAVHKGAIRALNGLGQDEEQRRAQLLSQIPATGGSNPAPAPDGKNNTEFSRNVGNTLMALPGGAPALGAISTIARSTPVIGNVLAATGSGVGALATKAAPYAAPAAGIGALSAASSPASTVPTPSAAVAPATSIAGDATMPGQDPGRPTANSLGAGIDVGNGVTRFNAPGKSPLFTNIPGDQASNEALVNRGAVTAQNQNAMNTIAGRYQAEATQGAQALINKEQYDREVAAATATNNWQDRQTLERAALGTPSFRGSQAIRPSKAALVQLGALQKQETEQRGQDIQDKQQGAIRKLAQDRLTLDTTKATQDAKGAQMDNEAKSTLLSAQRAMLDPKATPEQRAAAEKTYQVLSGKYEKQNNGQVISLPDTLGDQGKVIRGGQAVLMPDGKIVRPEQGAAPATLPPKDKLVKGQTYPTPRGNAIWDGSQFKPV